MAITHGRVTRRRFVGTVIGLGLLACLLLLFALLNARHAFSCSTAEEAEAPRAAVQEATPSPELEAAAIDEGPATVSEWRPRPAPRGSGFAADRPARPVSATPPARKPPVLEIVPVGALQMDETGPRLPDRLPDPVSADARQGGPPRPDPAPTLPPPRVLEPDKPSTGPPPRIVPDTESAVLLGAARTAVRRNDLEQALIRFEEYLNRNPDDQAVRREYAGILVQVSRTRQAVQQYQQLVAKEPDSIELRIGLADVLTYGRDFRQAIGVLHQALERALENTEVAVRLARAYAADGESSRALQIYERYLSRLRPDDRKTPSQLGALLLDLERPEEALAFLQAQRERHPKDTQLLGDLIRCLGRLGDRPQAMALAEELAARGPDTLSQRLTLGETLLASGEFDLAAYLYNQVLAGDPNNGSALVGLARVQVALFLPQPARQFLECVQPTAALKRTYLFVWAEYHQLVGEYTEAERIYRELLCKDECDNEARLALAALFEFMAEYEKARAEYRKALLAAPQSRRARLGIASTLTAQRRFPEAIDLCKQLLCEDPGNGAAMALLARALRKIGDWNSAIQQCRAFLECNGRNEVAALPVHLALGRALLDAGLYREAAQEFGCVLGRPAGRIPLALYGLLRAEERLGDPHHPLALPAVLGLPGGEVRNRLMLADLYAEDFDDRRVLELCQSVAACEPKNLAALIRLADVLQRQARWSGHVHDAVKTCKFILSLSPTNVRGALALARALATGQQFKDAIVAYEKLLAIAPRYTVAQREKARVLFADRQFDAAAAAYQSMLVPSADELLQLDRARFTQYDLRARQLLEPHPAVGVAGPLACAELAQVAARCGDPDVQACLQRMLIDYEARKAEQEGARLEGKAKDHKDWRNLEAVPLYKELIEFEPANEEARFDLGQVFSNLTWTRAGIKEYAELVSIDPQHREGVVALNHAGWTLNPGYLFRFSEFNQRGRDGLAQIERIRFNNSVVVPFGDADEFLQLGFDRVRLIPTGAPELDGNIPYIRGQIKCDPQLLCHAQLNGEMYANRIQDRPTYDVGFRYYHSDCLRVFGRTYLENVLESAGSLQQDIYRFGGVAGAYVQASRFWDYGGYYQLAYYSDVNVLNNFHLFTDYSFSLPPRQLKANLSVDYESFSQQTIFGPTPATRILDAVHPYFAPRSFAYYEGRIEWYHWLSRDYFTDSNQCWYSLQYGLGFDSNFNNYNVFRVLGNWDVKDWLSVGADANFMISDVYNMQSAVAYLLLRFPRCLR
jgi:tetratricopeptide (TPR) repeat protein